MHQNLPDFNQSRPVIQREFEQSSYDWPMSETYDFMGLDMASAAFTDHIAQSQTCEVTDWPDLAFSTTLNQDECQAVPPAGPSSIFATAVGDGEGEQKDDTAQDIDAPTDPLRSDGQPFDELVSLSRLLDVFYHSMPATDAMETLHHCTTHLRC